MRKESTDVYIRFVLVELDCQRFEMERLGVARRKQALEENRRTVYSDACASLWVFMSGILLQNHAANHVVKRDLSVEFPAVNSSDISRPVFFFF